MTRPTGPTPPQHSLPAWHVASSETVRALIANAVVPEQHHVSLGDVTLMPHQLDALARVRTAIREFHGALLADEVGLGKTYVALALAQDYANTHVIAPATLLPMWRAAIARTGATHIELHSLQTFSRTSPQRRHPARTTTRVNARRTAAAHATRQSTHTATTPRQRPLTPSNAMTAPRHTLVIVDEAHHLRTPNTNRYRAIAEFVSGHDLLLLSATPLHNRARELHHLLALFAGTRHDLVSQESLSRLVVRQTIDARMELVVTSARTAADGDTLDTAARHRAPPRVHEHPPIRFPHNRETVDAILALPSPLPARDGAVAGALIRIGLLRAWCSSDAALAHVINRRLLRGEALRQALAAGRHPTQAELRTWLVGDHEVQLAFPELLATETGESASLLETLERHLAALQSLLDQQRNQRRTDPARANALRQLVSAHPETPIIAFSQFTQTVQSLYRALADIAGVGALTGMHARIASGRISRLDAIARFAPTAQGRPPPPHHQAIRLLLTTDILAEGVNLQDAAVVVHLDLPWTDALKHQRVGRVARIGSPHPLVHVYAFAPPPQGDRALTLTTRLLTKATLSNRLVGYRSASTQPSSPTAPADLATALHTELARWRTSTTTNTSNSTPPVHPPIAATAAQTPAQTSATSPRTPIPVAHLSATSTGWLAALHTPDGPLLVCRTGRHAASTDTARLWQLISSATPYDTRSAQRHRHPTQSPAPARIRGSNPRDPLHAHRILQALGQLDRWLSDHIVSSVAGVSNTADSHAHARARRRLAELIATTPPLTRHSLHRELAAAERVIAHASGVAAEAALDTWARLDCAASALGKRSAVPASTNDAELELGVMPHRSESALASWLGRWKDHPPLRALADVNPAPSTASPVSNASAFPIRGDDDCPAVRIVGLLLFAPPQI